MEIGGLSLDEALPAVELPMPSPRGPVPEQLEALFEFDFSFQMLDNPEFATQAGFHDRDGALQDLSPQSWERRLEHNRNLLVRLEGLDLQAAGVGATQRLHAEIMKKALADESKAIDLGCHLCPLNHLGAVYESFFELLDWMVFETEEDFKKYLERLMAFPAQAQGYQDLLAYGATMRRMPAAKALLRQVPGRLKELIDSDLAELRRPMAGKDLNADLAEQIQQAIEHCFRGTLRGLLDFIEEFYMNFAREDPGCKALPQGPAVYAHCIRFHTDTDKTAREIHDLGLQEVARIESRFQAEVLDALGFKGAFAEFAASLKQDASFFYKSEEELLDGYRALVGRITEKLPDYFSVLPRMPLEVFPMQRGPVAFYLAGTADGRRPGRFQVNVTRVHERAQYEMPALALHEGVPGHHLQGARALENGEIPSFLRYLEDRRYEFGPARRPFYTAYLEGWALYCEALGEEMGMYSTPQELFGRLSMEMMRAVRLVVDTGIHEFDWSIERAASYMEEKTGMSANECSAECHRYAAWPGQALGYKIGQLAIEEMRRDAEAKLGTKFDLRAFHEVLLDAGPLPMDILASRVSEWVAATK